MEWVLVQDPVRTRFHRRSEKLIGRNEDTGLPGLECTQLFGTTVGRQHHDLAPAGAPADAELSISETLDGGDVPLVHPEAILNPLPDPLVVAVAAHGPSKDDARVLDRHLLGDDADQVVERLQLLVLRTNGDIHPRLARIPRLMSHELDDHLARELSLLLGREEASTEHVASTKELGRLVGHVELRTQTPTQAVREEGVGLRNGIVAELLDDLDAMGRDGTLLEVSDDLAILEVPAARVNPSEAERTPITVLEHLVADATKFPLRDGAHEPPVVHDEQLLLGGEI